MGQGLTDSELVEELGRHGADLAAAECHQVLLIAEIDRRDIWCDLGTRSCAHWLSWRIGLSIGAAREQLRVGHALEDLPLIRAAFASGEISYSKVRAVTRIATKATESTLVDWARWATAAQLELIVRSYRKADPKEGQEALERHERRFVRSYSDRDGMVVICARLAPDDAGVVLSAIEKARLAIEEDGEAETEDQESSESAESAESAENTEDVPAETSSTNSDPNLMELVGERDDAYARNQADALVAVCRSVLENGLSQSDETPAVSVVVHVDEKVLNDPSAEGCSHIEEVGTVSSHTARRLACDAGVMRLVYRQDGILEPEGKTQSIPRHIRRAVRTRDMGCRWPGCNQRRFVDCHHVIFWSKGGPTKVSNLVSLCRYHHRRVHEGGYRLEMNCAGVVRVWNPAGEEIDIVAPTRRASGPSLRDQHTQGGLSVHGDTLCCGYNDPFDLHDTMEWLYRANHSYTGSGDAA